MNNHDSAEIPLPTRSPWWMMLIQISPLIIQLIGEAYLRTQGIPATITISSGPKPLFEVKVPDVPGV